MNAKNHDSNVVKLETHQPKPIRFGSVCSGIEAASVAWHPIGWESAWFSEIEPFPSAVLAHHFPDVPNLGDMTKIRDRIASGEVYAPDVLVGGTPCFTAGHQVLTEQGYLPIEQITPGMRVVTHMGKLQRVVRIGSKQAKVGSLSAVGMPMGITCTPEHPFRSVMWESRNTRRNGEYTRVESFGEPDWTKAKDMQGKQWCALTSVDIEQPKICSTKFSDEAAMYIAGMYLGDGHVRGWRGKSKKAVVLSLNEDKFNKLLKFTPDQNITATREKNVVKVHICDTVFANWLLDNFGKGSEAKKIPAWCLSNEHKHLLLRGYIDTDGCKKESHCTINTVSKALAFGVGDLANTCGYVSSVAMIKTSDTTVIEGRTVNQRDYYQVRLFDKNLSRKSREYKGLLLRTVSKYEQLDTQEVFNIEVDEDHSYILNGAIVHNCQAFSVAGARKSLDDDRGQLTLEYVRLANEIDATRLVRGEQPVITVWENVPGVLSTKDNAFGCFLGALSGEDCELQPSGKKWTNAGCVFGPQRTVAWRVLDAQYFGVAQRRRRVFVVASARKGFNPTEVLFEFDGVRRDSAPSRSSGQKTTRSTGESIKTASYWDGKQLAGTLTKCGMNQLMPDKNNAQLFVYANGGEVCDTVTRKWAKGSGGPSGNETGNLAIHPQVVHGTQDPIIQDNQAFPLGCNHRQENAVYCGTQNDACRDVGYEIAPTLRAGNGGGAVNPVVNEPVTYGIPGNWIGRKPENGGNATEPMDNIAPCQTKTDRHAVAYAFDSLSSNSMKSPNPNSGCREVDLAKTLDTTDPNPSKNQGGIGILQSQAFGIQGSMIGRSDTAGPQGSGVSDDVSFTLTKGDRHAVGVLGGLHPNNVNLSIAPPKNELRLLKFELEARKTGNEKTLAAANN